MIDQIYIVGKDGNKRKPNTQEKEQAKDIITQMYNKYIEGFIGIFGVFIFLMGFNTYLFINMQKRSTGKSNENCIWQNLFQTEPHRDRGRTSSCQSCGRWRRQFPRAAAGVAP